MMTTPRALWDISPPVRAGSPVFPGDTPYAQQWTASLAPGCPVNVSAITLSPLGLQYIPMTRVENMCATGTEALRAASYAVAARLVSGNTALSRTTTLAPV